MPASLALETSFDTASGARFDPEARYRYLLWRRWQPERPRACFVMLNPSTADAAGDDPTIRRCIAFARAHGFGGIEVVNLFAFRATRPAELRSATDPRGDENDAHVAGAIARCAVTIAAWGNHGHDAWHDLAPLRDADLHCLGTTQAGAPRHPLYLPGATRLRPWVRPGD